MYLKTILMFFLRNRRQPRSKRTDTLFPYSTLVRAGQARAAPRGNAARPSATRPRRPRRASLRSRRSPDPPAPPTDSGARDRGVRTRAATWCRSEEHTSELQSLMRISYAVFCLKKKNNSHTILIFFFLIIDFNL